MTYLITDFQLDAPKLLYKQILYHINNDFFNSNSVGNIIGENHRGKKRKRSRHVCLHKYIYIYIHILSIEIQKNRQTNNVQTFNTYCLNIYI